MNVVQMSLLAVAGVLLAMVLKKERPEFGIVISIVVCACIFFSVLGRLSILLEAVGRLRDLATLDHVCGGVRGQSVQGCRLCHDCLPDRDVFQNIDPVAGASGH